MLEQYLIDQLPDYILTNDSYKDGGQQGFIERYLRIFGQEWDTETMPLLDGYDSTIGPYGCPTEHLRYLEDLQGDIKNWGPTEHDRRKFLSYIVSVYNIKGTIASMKAILGLRKINIIAVQEQVPVGVTYDADPLGLYDEAEPILYDDTCPLCTEVVILGLSGYNVDITEEELIILHELLDLVTPINVSTRFVQAYIATAPANLTAEFGPDISSQVTLDWTSTSGGSESGFEIEWSTDSVNFDLLANTPKETEQYIQNF